MEEEHSAYWDLATILTTSTAMKEKEEVSCLTLLLVCLSCMVGVRYVVLYYKASLVQRLDTPDCRTFSSGGTGHDPGQINLLIFC